MNSYGIKDRRNNPLPPLSGLPADPNIPSMSAHPVSNVHGLLTPNSGGQHDVASPGSSTSGVNSGSSHSALSSISQYSHSSWSTPGAASSPFGFGSISGGQAASQQQQHYDHKPGSFDSTSSMYTLSRPSPASSAHGDALNTPTYAGQAHGHGQQQHQYPGLFGHGGSTLPSHGSAAVTSPGGLMGNANPATTQPPTPSSATAPHDPYNRPSSTQNYFAGASTPHQPSYTAFPPSGPSPTTAAGNPRGLLSHSGMAPPQAYRAYPSFQSTMPIPSMNSGPIMSNLNNPGGQMSVMPGMGVPSYSHHLSQSMYGPPMHQQERPYKCQQCPQSFNRNHDLKRHTRIHLSVKPFPCGSCDKAFSRKDALKRHRLVKGCGDPNKDADNSSNHDGSGPSEASASESPTTKRE